MAPARSRMAVLTVLFALILAVPALAAPIAPAPSIADDLKYLPDDTNFLYVLQMDKLVASDAFKKLRKDFPMLDKDLDSGFRQNFGFEITNIERTVIGGNFKTEAVVGVLHLKIAVKADAIAKARSESRFQSDKGLTFKEEKAGALTMYVPDQDSGQTTAFCLLNDKTVVLGKVKQLREVLARNKKATLSAGLQASLKEMDLTAALTLAMDLKSIAAIEKPPMVPGVDVNLILASVEGVSLSIKVGTDVSMRGVAVCKDAKAAEDVKQQGEAIRMLLDKLMQGAPKGAVPKEVLDLPGKVKLATKGQRAEATLTVSTDTALAFIKISIIGSGGSAAPPVKPKPPVEKKP